MYIARYFLKFSFKANFSQVLQLSKCKFKKFLMAVNAICLRIKVAELNILSVGKGITGIPSTVF